MHALKCIYKINLPLLEDQIVGGLSKEKVYIYINIYTDIDSAHHHPSIGSMLIPITMKIVSNVFPVW